MFFRRILQTCALAGAACFVSTAVADIAVESFGANGWRSSDTRNASGVTLYGTVNTHPGLAGPYSGASDTAIASQIRWSPEGYSPSPSGIPLTMTGSHLGNGALQLYATTSNSGKANLTRRNTMTGFGPATDLVAPGFFFNYRQFTIADTTFRTPGVNIGVLGTNAGQYFFVFADPAHTIAGAGVWTTSNVNNTTNFLLYGPGAPGGAGPSQSLAAWQADPTWGPILFGAGAIIDEVGFTLGSSQRNAYVYLDWVETSILDSGERNDFAFTPPTIRMTSASTTTCNNTNTLTVNIDGAGVAGVAGGQFFVQWDTARLSLASVVPGPNLQLFYNQPNGGGRDIGVGNNLGGPLVGSQTMATLTFNVAGSEACNLASLVSFRTGTPLPSRLTDNQGNDLGAALANLGGVTLDSVAPTITYCPPNVQVQCTVDPIPANTGGPATATDTCGTAVVTYTDASVTPVYPGNLGDWSLFATLANSNTPGGDGTADFQSGPATPPLGSGSAHLNTGSSGEQTAQMRNDAWATTPLSALTSLGYSTYGTSWNGGQMTYLTLYIDLNGDTVYDDRVFFEPDYSSAGYANPFNVSPQPATALNTWQTWDALHGMWYGDNFAGPGQDARPLSMYIAANPTARIVNANPTQGGIRIAAGFASPGDVFNMYVDNFFISTASSGAVYDFEASPAFPCTPHVITRTWKATDNCGNFSTCTQVITVADTLAPQVVCAPSISVNADAGSCSALVDLFSSTTEAFNSNPTLSATQAPGVWYTDRYAPAGFTSAVFAGGNRLKHSISAADCSPCRGGGFVGAFYDTQGRKFDIAGSNEMSIDLYVDASWATSNKRMAGFWGTGFDNSLAVSGFPIIEFTSDGGIPRFRGWDNGVWVDMGLPSGFAYNAFYTLHIQLVGSNFIYTVGNLTLTVPATGSTSIGNVILQGHNNTAGVTYDIYWDNFTHQTNPFAADNCDTNPVITGVRSDMLPLSAPFPSTGAGNTTITWTATDCAGNSSFCNQVVHVNALNTVNAAVEVSGLTGPSTRCITFQFWNACVMAQTVAVDVAFDATGHGTATFDVPCNSPAYTGLTVEDQKHTLRRTSAGVANFSNNGVVYSVDFTSASGKALEQGNLNNDAYVDILDAGIFLGRWNTSPGVDSPCGYLGFHADFSGNGLVFTEDFTFIQNAFLDFRDLDPCGGALTGSGPVTDISVDDAVAQGLREVAMIDYTLDGRVNSADIAWIVANGLPRCIADFNDDQRTDVSDIFSYLNAWFMAHPRADTNANTRLEVQDLFDFINVWFQGC